MSGLCHKNTIESVYRFVMPDENEPQGDAENPQASPPSMQELKALSIEELMNIPVIVQDPVQIEANMIDAEVAAEAAAREAAFQASVMAEADRIMAAENAAQNNQPSTPPTPPNEGPSDFVDYGDGTCGGYGPAVVPDDEEVEEEKATGED